MEKREQKIMVAVDESQESMYALSWCIINFFSDTTSSTTNKLVLLYVKPSPSVYSPLDAPGLILYKSISASFSFFSIPNSLLCSLLDISILLFNLQGIYFRATLLGPWISTIRVWSLRLWKELKPFAGT